MGLMKTSYMMEMVQRKVKMAVRSVVTTRLHGSFDRRSHQKKRTVGIARHVSIILILWECLQLKIAAKIVPVRKNFQIAR